MLTALVVVAIAGVGIALLFNKLVRDRNRCESAWSDIDVQLQRRHDLIPQLVTAVHQYAKYERATLAAVTELRAEAMRQTSIAARGDAEQQLSERVGKLIALAEQYPDLKASENFLHLQQDLVETENYLQFARRFYNGSVRQYQNATESFPGILIAKMFGFAEREYFQKSSDSAAAVPLVDLGSVE